MRIDSPLMTNAVITGSFSGSFTGIGNFTGLEADSVEFANVLNKPTLVSGSAQIAADISGSFTSLSASIASDIAGLDGNYATDAELNASSSALTTAYRSELNASSSALISAYGSADTTLSSSLAADIASNLSSINSIGSFTASLDTDLTTLSLPANTTISSFGASLVDDADASAARTTLGVDAAGTDNSTDVTLVTTSHDYLSITGQAITLGTVDISDDTNLTAGTGVTLTGDTLSIGQAVGTGDSVTFASLTTTGNVTIQGDLSVLGDAVEIQVGSLSIEDKNILVASGAADSAAADGAGITIGGANESLTWNHANSRFNLSDDLNVEGNITLTGTVDGRDIASDGSKLDGIATNANNYTHPSYTARSIDTTGAEVLDVFTSDTSGHVTSITKRTMTLADLGYTGATNANNYVHPSHPGDDFSVDSGALTGAVVISDIDINVTTDTLGHVTDANGTIATRTLTLADLGYTGATNANNYSLPEATATVRGGIELFSNTDQTVAANAVTATAGRTYGIQLNSAGQAVVNVPWVDTNTTYTRASFINQDVNTTNNVHFEGLMVGQTTGATANTIRCVGDVVAYYSSDAQFKDNVETLEGALDKVKAIRGVRFDWNDKQDVHTGHDIGVIAQEVEAVLPELVHHREHNDSKAVDYVKLTAVLIEAVKELAAKVEELEKK